MKPLSLVIWAFFGANGGVSIWFRASDGPLKHTKTFSSRTPKGMFFGGFLLHKTNQKSIPLGLLVVLHVFKF